VRVVESPRPSRIRLPRPDGRNATLVLLAGLAGWVDALSFSELGQVFTSFQSGNFIFLGLAVDEGDTEKLVGAAVSLAAFLAGTALGAYVVGRGELQPPDVRSLARGLVLELALLVGFAISWQAVSDPGASAGRVVLIVVAALAMGVQGATLFALRIPGVLTNAMTATLMLGGVMLGLRARGPAADRRVSPLSGGFLAAMCASYVVSALVVGVVDRPHVTSVVPAALLALTLLGLVTRERRSTRTGQHPYRGGPGRPHPVSP
jgi:uncharacterized membrane protein YoaK (UPF0700 family)